MPLPATAARPLRRARHRPIFRPELGLFAAMLLGLLTFFPLAGTGLSSEEPPLRLPHLRRGNPCLPDKGVVAISIDAAGRFYFSTDARSVQVAAIRQLAAQYGVLFTEQQLAELERLPYLGMDVRQLPAYLSLSLPERRRLPLPGLPHGRPNDQLAACLLLARRLNIEQFSSAPYLQLRADAQTPAADIRHFTRTLQQKGLHRFYASFQ